MNRGMMVCVAAVCLGTPLAGAAVRADEARRPVSVPAWGEFDGKRWGDLVLGETTRAAFDENYLSSRTGHDEALQAVTPKRSGTQLYVLFDGSGQEARLTWIVCFYQDPGRAPQPADLVGRAEWREFEGYALTRRAGWRIFAAPEHGLAVVAELRKASYGVAALIMGAPQRMTDVVGRLQPAPPLGSPPAPDDARTPLRAPVGEPEIDVQVSPTLPVDGVRLRSVLAQTTEKKIRDWPVLQMTEGSEGRLAVGLDVEPGQPGDQNRITLTARVSLDTESAGLAIHASSPVDRRILDAAVGDGRIQDEARGMVERGIDAVAGSAQEQLQRHQAELISAAQQEVRPALLDFLVSADQSPMRRSNHDSPAG